LLLSLLFPNPEPRTTFLYLQISLWYTTNRQKSDAEDRFLAPNNEQTPPGDSSPQDSGENLHVFSLPAPTHTPRDPETIAVPELSRLATVLERMRLSDYIEMMQSPRRLILFNFLAGLARGIGFIVGMTVVATVALLLLSHLVNLPLVGKYIAKIVEIVQQEIGYNHRH
jgi:hypothetical protein